MEYEALRPGIHSCMSEENVMARTRNANGTWSHEYTLREYIQTPSGMMEQSAWYAAAEEAIAAHGDTELFESVLSHVREHMFCFHGPNAERDQRRYALECFLSEAYKAWAERGEFDYLPVCTGWRQLTLSDLIGR